MNLKNSKKLFLYLDHPAKHKILGIFRQGLKYFNEFAKKRRISLILGRSILSSIISLFWIDLYLAGCEKNINTHYIQHPFICPHEKINSKFTKLDSSRLKNFEFPFLLLFKKDFCFVLFPTSPIIIFSSSSFSLSLSLSLSLASSFFIKILSDEAFNVVYKRFFSAFVVSKMLWGH
jgi:hypothetical protein